MYISFKAIILYIFNYYQQINIFFFSFFFFLIYFFYSKSLFVIFEWNSLIEDRILILLESIIKIEYNLILLMLIVIYFNILIVKIPVSIIKLMLAYNFFYIAFNQNVQDFLSLYFFNFNLNQKLLNGLFLIHPYCIYLFYSLFFVYWFLYVNINYIKNNKILSISQKILYKQLTKLNIHILILGLIAITLGAWWAYQEINWNNWWSWDLIEIINFILILFSLSLLHMDIFKNYQNKDKFLKKITFFFIFLFFLILSRYNIINSLHSFVILNNFEQYSYYFIIFFLLILFFLNTINLFYTRLIRYNIKLILNLINFFYILLVIYIYKIFYEIILFIFQLESFLEFFYYYKNINYFLIFSIFLTNITNITIIFLNLNIFINYFLNFIEILFIVLFISLFWILNSRFFKIHFFVFLFILLIYINILISSFTFKLWNLNFFYIIENIKISTITLKKNYFYLKSYIPNFYINKIYYFYCNSMNLNFLTIQKTLIFFLSNFFFLNDIVIIVTNNYFFFYSIIFFNFIGLYFCLFYMFILIYYFIFLNIKKKLIINII